MYGKVFFLLLWCLNALILVHGGFEYSYIQDIKNWQDARSDCEGRGGTLAVLSDQSRIDQVKNSLNVLSQAWIGFRSPPNKDKHKWVDKTIVGGNGVDAWLKTGGQTEPTYGGQRCGMITPDRNGNLWWADNACRQARKYICQKEVGTRSCHARGDPHYTTFDGLKYDFQGSCTYLYTSLCPGETVGSDVRFEVLVKNHPAADKSRGVSMLDYVMVNFYFTPNQPHRLIMGSALRTLRICEPGFTSMESCQLYNLPQLNIPGMTGVKIIQEGNRKMRLETDFGLVVQYATQYIHVELPETYVNKVCGLCGNMNGNATDDTYVDGKQSDSFPRRGFSGKMKYDFTPFGNLQVQLEDTYENPPGCVVEGPPPDCDETTSTVVTSRCMMLSATTLDSPFAACITAINADPNLEVITSQDADDCFFDSCAMGDPDKTSCEQLEAFAQSCYDMKVDISGWRAASSCPMTCGSNMEYVENMSGCPNTCADPDTEDDCELPSTDGCKCTAGMIFLNLKCVPTSGCGCSGPFGQMNPAESYITTDCRTKKVCQADGSFQNVALPACQGDTSCKVVNGMRGCFPNDVIRTCGAQGDPHFHTFDGLLYDFQGACTYTLTAPKPGVTVGGNIRFEVLVKNLAYPEASRGVSMVEYIIVNLYFNADNPHRVILGRGANLLRICQPGITDLSTCRRYSIPEINIPGMPGVTIRQTGDQIRLSTNFGLVVRHRNIYASVDLPGTYAGKVEGLCGDMNGNPSDDTYDEEGKQTPSYSRVGLSGRIKYDFTDFGNSQVKTDLIYDNSADCQSKGPPPSCTTAATTQVTLRCSMLSADNMDSPFAECIQVLSADPYQASFSTEIADDCFFDSCVKDTPDETSCDMLTAFAQVCYAKGVSIPGWRATSNCPMDCGDDMEYVEDMIGCQNCCTIPNDEDTCDLPRTEGCKCKVSGQLKINDQCVPQSNCGCTGPLGQMEVDEIYITDDCQQKKICKDDGTLDTQPFTECPEGYECSVVDGELGCNPLTQTTITPDTTTGIGPQPSPPPRGACPAKNRRRSGRCGRR